MYEFGELKEKCIIHCINPDLATSYKSKHKELSDDEIVAYYVKKNNIDINKLTIEDYCKTLKLDINEVKDYIESINDIFIDNDKEDELAELKLSDYILGYAYNKVNQTIETICDISGISVARFKGVKRRHYDWTNEEILEYCMFNKPDHVNIIYTVILDGKQMVLSDVCKKLGVNHSTLISYKNKHNLSPEEALEILSRKVGINILGELITLK